MENKSTLQLMSLFYRDHHGWLVGWLRTKLNCSEAAADFAHEAFCRLFALPHLGEVREPRAFLMTTAMRLVIDDARRRRIEHTYVETYACHGVKGMAPSSEIVVDMRDTLNALTVMLDSLPEKPRRAFFMSRLDGRRQSEIAAELGVSVSRVKQYIARVLMHCRHI